MDNDKLKNKIKFSNFFLYMKQKQYEKTIRLVSEIEEELNKILKNFNLIKFDIENISETERENYIIKECKISREEINGEIETNHKDIGYYIPKLSEAQPVYNFKFNFDLLIDISEEYKKILEKLIKEHPKDVNIKCIKLFLENLEFLFKKVITNVLEQYKKNTMYMKYSITRFSYKKKITEYLNSIEQQKNFEIYCSFKVFLSISV